MFGVPVGPSVVLLLPSLCSIKTNLCLLLGRGGGGGGQTNKQKKKKNKLTENNDCTGNRRKISEQDQVQKFQL